MWRILSHQKTVKVYNFIAIVITLCLLDGCAKHVETHELTPPLSSTVIGDALSASEKLFAERSDIEKLRQAVVTLGRARNPDQRNYEVEWKFAKYSYFLGKAEPIQNDAIAAFEKGRDAGRIAARVDKTKPDGHFWYAANMGELARINPVTVGIRSVDEIREEMTAVIDIQPDYQNGSAFDGLGQLEMATRNFKGGSAAKAAEYFARGIELSPENANLRLHLAESFLALKRDSDARKQLDALISLKVDEEFKTEHLEAVEKGKKLIQDNF